MPVEKPKPEEPTEPGTPDPSDPNKPGDPEPTDPAAPGNGIGRNTGGNGGEMGETPMPSKPSAIKSGIDSLSRTGAEVGAVAGLGALLVAIGAGAHSIFHREND